MRHVHTSGAVLAVAIALLGLFATRLAAAPCPDHPVVGKVEAVRIYTDPNSSVVDPEKVRERDQQVAPLRDFVTDASKEIDSGDRSQEQCAFSQMLSWAKGKSMEEEPEDLSGQYERLQYTLALNIIALKLRAAAFNITPLLGWVGNVNHGVINFFATRDKPKQMNNIYVWSGVAAASYALLSGDSAARLYEDEVWNNVITMIRPDGYIDTELKRAGRALHYHVYYLSAVMALHAFRDALGEPMSDADRDAVERLVKAVGDALCNPSNIAAASGGYQQETVPPWLFAPAEAFGAASQNFRTCAPQDIPMGNPVFGGSLTKTEKILSKVRASAQ
jgi:poly(beta-D-mannuronate) lyase